MAKPSKGIAQLSNAVDVLVSQFIRPNAQQALANYERIERIEGVAERNVEAIASLASSSEANRQAIASLTALSEANQQQIAANAEANAQSQGRLTRIEDITAENGRQIDILIAEGRVDRQNTRDAIASLTASSEANQRQIAANIEASIPKPGQASPDRRSHN
jgi:Mg/Co/Ni transporter MgtE